MAAIRKTSKQLAAWIVAGAALLSSALPAAAEQPDSKRQIDAQAVPSPIRAPDFAFNADPVSQPRFTLPFYLFNGHILIDGAVNGRHGKFMFDTGTEFPFFLNNHFIELSKDQFVGQGHAGSGQKMVLYRQNAPLASIEIAGVIRFENLPATIHTDWSFIEQAYTPHFLGSIGHGFNRNYLFAIDYAAQTITFNSFDQDEAALARLIEPDRVFAILDFTPTGVDGKMPELEMQIGDETLSVLFDTGNLGTLELTESMQKKLQAQGKLILSAREYAYGAHEPHTRAILKGLSYGTRTLGDADGLRFKNGARNQLGLGYHFLKGFVSVWDYKHNKLTLLKP